MSRLIDADALITWFDEHYDDEYVTVGFVTGLIKDEPTIEPERKKGCWISVDSYTAFGGDEMLWMSHGNPIALHYCSECKNDAYAGEDGEDLLTDFCPNCGADMRGE